MRALTRNDLLQRRIVIPPQTRSDATTRRCQASASILDAGPDFPTKLAASLKDYARGATEYPGGQPFMTALDDEVTAAEIRRACKDDPCVYRLWFRPYDGGAIVDRAFVREFMARVEQATVIGLHWYAAIHFKPTVAFEEHRHFHAIIRGITKGGSALKIKRSPLVRHFTTVGRALLTERLGPMSERELLSARVVSAINRPRAIKMQRMRRAGLKGWQIQQAMGLAR